LGKKGKGKKGKRKKGKGKGGSKTVERNRKKKWNKSEEKKQYTVFCSHKVTILLFPSSFFIQNCSFLMCIESLSKGNFS